MSTVYSGVYSVGYDSFIFDFVTDIPIYFFTIVFLNLSFAILFFQWILVPDSIIIINC